MGDMNEGINMNEEGFFKSNPFWTCHVLNENMSMNMRCAIFAVAWADAFGKRASISSLAGWLGDFDFQQRVYTSY